MAFLRAYRFAGGAGTAAVSAGGVVVRILLLGGAGFLGANLTEALLNSGHSVHIVDRNLESMRSCSVLAGAASLHDLDVTEAADLVGLVDQLAIECVVNLVSTLLPSSSYEAFAGEIRKVTVPAFELVGELVRRKIKYVYFSSGGTVYGADGDGDKSEDARTLPINHYGLAKLLFEQYVLFLSRTQGLRYLIVRPSNPYGPFQNPQRMQGLVAVTLDRILRGKEIEIWGDGSVVRDYVWVKDLAHAVTSLMATSPWNETYNIGTGIGYSVNQVISVISSVVGRSATVSYRPARVVDAPRIVLNIGKLKRTVHYDPVDFRDGIERYLGGLSGV